MNHQRRRFEFVGEQMRREFPVQLAVFPWWTFELPLGKPELFGRSPRRFRIEHAIMRHDALETIGVAEDPVGHVTAIARAERGHAVLVDERIGLLHVIEPLHQIDIRFAAPIAADRVGKLLPITGRAVKNSRFPGPNVRSSAWRRASSRNSLPCRVSTYEIGASP